MGYLTSITNGINLYALLLTIGIVIASLAIVIFIHFHMKEKQGRWKVETRMDAMVNRQMDNIDKIIAKTDKHLKTHKIKFNSKRFVLIIGIFALGVFIWSYLHFRNFLASALISLIIFLIPEYVFFLLYTSLNVKIDNQVVVAVRVFAAEYLKSKNIEKSLVETSKRVKDPVGGYFEDAYAELIMGYDYEASILRMGPKTDNKYWKIFTQLLLQLRSDSTVIHLFADLVTRIERHLEITRNHESSMAGERVVAMLMTLMPIPAYLFINSFIEETHYFMTETTMGRFILVLTLASTVLFLYIDRYSRKV